MKIFGTCSISLKSYELVLIFMLNTVTNSPFNYNAISGNQGMEIMQKTGHSAACMGSLDEKGQIFP